MTLVKVQTPLEALGELDRQRFQELWESLTDEARTQALAVIDHEYHNINDKTAGSLAFRLDSSIVQTPALDVIDRKLCEVRDALACMYERRALTAQLIRSGVKPRAAVEQVSEEIPQRGCRRLILSMPPQEGKSSRVSRYGLEWLLRQFPMMRAVIVSYDGSNASQFSYQIRTDIEVYDGVNEDIDLGLRLVRNEKARGRWQLATKGSLYAVGLGGGLTGRPVDFMDIDDPVKDYRAADSDLVSQVTWEWLQTVGKTRLAPGAPLMITMTRWHEADLAGRCMIKQQEDEALGLEHYDKWDILNIPAQADQKEGERDILGRQPGEYMTSARGRTKADWEAIKNGIDGRFWNALYQGKPSPDEGTILLKQWWRRYDEVLWTQKPDGSFRLPSGYDVSQSWDFTFKGGSGSDFVVGGVWAKKGADSYLVYLVRAQLTFTQTQDAMRRVTRLFPQARMKIVESAANGEAIIDSLKHEIAGITTFHPDVDKVARARAISPFIRSGNIHLPTIEVATALPTIAFSVEDFIIECTSFPNGAHDDQVDMMTQYLKVKYIEGGDGELMMPSGRVPIGTQRKLPIVRTPKESRDQLSPVQKRLLEITEAKERGVIE
jgi:predicted phage terminase large subunit-like protein